MKKGIAAIQKQIDAYALISGHKFALEPEGIQCRVNGKMHAENLLVYRYSYVDAE